MTFSSKSNNAQSFLYSTHTSGDGILVINPGDQSVFNFTSLPTRVTVYPVSGQTNIGQKYGTIFNVNSVSNNTLYVTVASDELPLPVDQTMTTGTVVWNVEQDITVGTFLEHENVLNDLTSQNSTWYTDTGTVNAIVITPSPAITAYKSGQVFNFIPAFSNTGAASINISGLGAKTIRYIGQSLSPGFLNTSYIAQVIYDGTNFQLRNPATNVLGSASITTPFTTTSTSAVQITGLTTSVTVPTGRSVKITASSTEIYNSAMGSYSVSLTIWDGVVGSGTQISQGTQNLASLGSNLGIPINCSILVTPTNGTHVYNIGLQVGGGGTANLTATTNSPAYILVEMI